MQMPANLKLDADMIWTVDFFEICLMPGVGAHK